MTRSTGLARVGGQSGARARPGGSPTSCHPALARQPVSVRGFSLIELMVALAITMALSAGMLSMLANTRVTSAAQSQMEQFQEDERLLLTRLTDTIQNAGYFPNPQGTTQANVLGVVNGQFATAGQSLSGTTGGAAPGDTLVVRYQASTTDGVMDCSGKTNTTGSALVMVNSFSVDANGVLNCSVNGGASQPLATGVNNFKVQYGIDSTGSGWMDSYRSASAMTASNWTNVYSVRLSITLQNPLAGQPGQPATLPAITQVIPVLNQL